MLARLLGWPHGVGSLLQSPWRTPSMIAARSCFVAALATTFLAAGCGGGEGGDGTPVEQACVVAAGATAPDFVQNIGCRADFDTLASLPLDSSIPGARSVKFVIDRRD